MRLDYSSSNPVFSKKLWPSKPDATKKFSVFGVLVKTLCSLVLLCASLSITWFLAAENKPIYWLTTAGMLIALLLSFTIAFKPKWAYILVPFYAIAKGLFMGGFSYYIHKEFPYLPLKAVLITALVFFIMLLLYNTRIIRVTQKLRTVITVAIISIMTLYITTFILGLFGIHFPFLWDTSWLAIGFNLFAALTAAFSLLLDFDTIEKQKNKAPKANEWIATWGILVSLIWLYVEVLRLLRKFAIRF